MGEISNDLSLISSVSDIVFSSYLCQDVCSNIGDQAKAKRGGHASDTGQHIIAMRKPSASIQTKVAPAFGEDQ
jgi:hypothetical protein